MLDIKLLRQNPKECEAALRSKDPSVNLQPLLDLDIQIRELKQETQQLQHQRNELSKTVGLKKRKGEDASVEMEEVKTISTKLSTCEATLTTLEESFSQMMGALPNLPDSRVKNSQDIEENVVLNTFGPFPHFDFEPTHHLDLGKNLNLFDFEASAKTTGSNWPWYTNLGARLEWALLNYMIDIQLNNGFEFALPPIMVRPEAMYHSGQLPKFKGQFYEIDDPKDPLYVIPTAEVVLNSKHSNHIFDLKELPKLYAAYTPCFRREAGAAGEKERGLIRMHQFNKVEMFAFSTPEESERIFNHMMDVAKQILEGLDLHFRFTELVTGDMSFGASRTVDVEVYLPGQNRYYEVSSISNCTDFQARRSKIRFKNSDNQTQFAYTLNGSGLATPRLMVALLENHQNADGSIKLPTVLQEKLNLETLSV